jgi:uncharacterized membrane protein
VRYRGYLPILFVVVGGSIGATMAESIGAFGWVGGIVGAVIGYFSCRTILRAAYEDDLNGD